MHCFNLFCIFFLAILLTGCSKISLPDDGFVSDVVANKIGSQVEWHHVYCQDERASHFIQCMINSELNADIAIQIALLNNPKVQAVFEDLGIAQADLIEAGLLSNPLIEVEARFPCRKRFRTNIEYLLTTSLLDAFLIPLKIKLAKTEFEQAKLRVSNTILNLAFDVRETFYQLVTEQQKIKYLRSAVEILSILGEISSKQLTVGNIYSLEFQLAESRFLEAELDLSQSLTEIIRLKEKLNQLLGFDSDFCLIFPETLPNDFDYQGFDLCALESIAIEERLDIQIARLELVRFKRMLGLKDWWTYTKLQGGLAGKRERDGTNLIGPGISAVLPIFNFGQAARLRLFAEFRQAQDRLDELIISVRSEVREAHNLLMSYLNILNEYKGRLLPVYREISASSEELYNVMGLGVDKLLENKRLEIAAIKNYIESAKKYLVASVELDRALGGYLFKLLIQREYHQEGSE